jgi:hypothetical protein
MNLGTWRRGFLPIVAIAAAGGLAVALAGIGLAYDIDTAFEALMGLTGLTALALHLAIPASRLS